MNIDTPDGQHVAGFAVDGARLQAVCPGCGGDHVHPQFDRLVQEDTDGYTCPLGTRGGWLAFPMWCEHCWAEWRFVIGFHKGQTFVGAANHAPAVAA